MKKEHLFITTTFFDKCHKYKIFGVRSSSINQLGLVERGDKVFFLSKKDGRIIGPYRVISDVFYNDEVMWKEKDGHDIYPFRVKLDFDKVYFVDSYKFSAFVESNKLRIDTGDINQRSVYILLPKDLRILENFLKQNGRELEIENPCINRKFQEIKIDIDLALKLGFSEAFLEFFILKNFNEYFKDENFLLYNQFIINLFGSRIDILALSEKEIIIIELKKGSVKDRDVEKFKTYINWVENNIKLLENFFNINLEGVKINSLIIGSEFKIKNIHKAEKIHLKEYYIKKTIN